MTRQKEPQKKEGKMKSDVLDGRWWCGLKVSNELFYPAGEKTNKSGWAGVCGNDEPEGFWEVKLWIRETIMKLITRSFSHCLSALRDGIQMFSHLLASRLASCYLWIVGNNEKIDNMNWGFGWKQCTTMRSALRSLSGVEHLYIYLVLDIFTGE